jgi:NAD(P)-dependent dehydrogenase (short-subunit alcohol dehydrogenase family)
MVEMPGGSAGGLPRRFVDKTVIVTGGASGIGAATARRFAGEGARVLVADVQERLGEDVAGEIRSWGGQAFARRCDVSSLADWHELVAEALARFSRLDVVHNNAYIIELSPTHELSEESWDRQIAVCLKQVFLSVKACLPHLLETDGVMINTSSVHSVLGFPHHSAYDAAKGAISALTRQLASEYGPRVRVNAVLPGAILTPAWDGTSEAEREAFAANTPARRLGRPEEVAAAVCFLASEDASFITGENLLVDGGWTITKA